MEPSGKSVKEAKSGSAVSATEVDAFLRQVALAPGSPVGTGRGRLVFAMDATASRQAAWAEAQRVQTEMFQAVSGLGGLDMQLVFFRGQGECRASGWVSDAADVMRLMRQVDCVGGHTQIERVLCHTLAETREARVNALVYVGDAVEENLDDIAVRAGELALLGVPVFAFQEGDDPQARACLKDVARLTRGAYAVFDSAAAATLAQLLKAVAVYAAGGYRALNDFAASAGPDVKRLAGQLQAPGR